MTSYFAPLRGESAEPLALDMQSLFLSGQIAPFGAKLSVTHVFRSSEKTPVEVVYCFPLPRDASLAGFQITGATFSISSRLEPAADARKRYEEALFKGSLTALTRQNLDGRVNLAVGNLRPGETVSVRLDLIAGVSLSDSGFRLRFPFTVAPCYHPQMHASLDEPGVGRVDLPEAVAGGVVLPPFHGDASHLHKIGFELCVAPAMDIGEIASPSHAIRVLLSGRDAIRIRLSPDRDVPNRDLVLDVEHDFGTGRAWADQPSDDCKQFAVIVPSTAFGPTVKATRRVVFLLDRSGSMDGAPIQQALHAIDNCLAKLCPEDRFGLVAFDDRVECFREATTTATRDNLAEACEFLNTIDARGGTELARGIEAAARLLEGSTGEIFIVTDGQVFETVEILRRARKCEVRLFCLGIGSASQDRFLELLARQTGGVCRFVMPSERVETAALDVFAATGGAIASEVRITSANVQPTPAGIVFSGTPFVAFGHTDRDAASVELEWPQASARVPLENVYEGLQGFIEKLHGAKLIADFETHYDGSDAGRQQLRHLSERYGLASSEMSLVALVERRDDEVANVPKTKIVPVGVPQDTKFDAYFELDAGCCAPIRFRPADPEFCGLADKDLEAPQIDWDSLLQPGPADRLLETVHEAIALVDDRASLRTVPDANDRLTDVLSRLFMNEEDAANEVQKGAVAALIDFLSSEMIDFLETDRLDLGKWQAIRRQLEQAWPELANTAASHPDRSAEIAEDKQTPSPRLS